MIEAGFEDVQEKTFYWPTSPWAKGEYYKNVAAYFQQDMLLGLDGISTKALGLLGWEAERIREFLGRVKGDFRDTNIKAFQPV